MSFEEKFPSLQKMNWFEMIDNGEVDNVIHAIEDNTIDKQRLKDVINKLSSEFEISENKDGITIDWKVVLSLIKKELGLED